MNIPLPDIISTLFGGGGTSLYERIIWNIRVPQVLTAVVAGAGLTIAGVAQCSRFSAISSCLPVHVRPFY